ncbi:MAG: hypothetical protein ACRDLL_10510 [Solirubrobacterales bacterium]
MTTGPSGSARRPATIALCLMLLSTAIAVLCAATAHAADYKMLLCAGGNGSNSYQTATNTSYSKYPGGIFNFENYCGSAPDPAGNSAFLRIRDVAPDGTSAETAYGSISWTVPPWVAILAAGGYTREPATFNQGWRARFWAEDFGGGGTSILMQGAGVDNGSLGGTGWAMTSIFAPHVWPFTSFGYYRRFIFEVTCFRPAGCDRSGENIADANTIALVLTDVSPVDLQLTNTSAPLLSGAWVRGAQTATYSWSDAGSGIRMEWIDIDGNRRFTIDHAGDCDTGASGPNGQFARVFQPCPTGANIGRSYAFDTASLPDGLHTLQTCGQDFGQWQGLYGTGGASCRQATIRTDNTAPGAPAGLQVTSANPQRYLPHVGAHWQLPPNQGSPIAAVHYQVVDATGNAVTPERTVPGSNPTELADIEGPARAGDYRLRLWLEDAVGLQGPAATAPLPHDTTPPAAPQDISVTAPETARSAEGFDLRWRNIGDAGSPIDAAHYQVLDGTGKVVLPIETIAGANPERIANLDAPTPSGVYTLRIWLTDSEGNVGAPASAPLSYQCVRSAVPGGAQLDAGFSGAPEQTVKQEKGAMLSGTLRSTDRGPLAGAPVCVFSRVLTDSGRAFLGIALTNASGEWRFPISAGPSRQLEARYRPDQRELSAEATLHTRVRPTFAVARDMVRNGGYAHFSGQIPGPHNDRVVIVLQVKSGKGWRAFRRYRTRADGRFTVRYRFTRTTTPTSYVMRAQVREQVGYPYLQGNSRSLPLRVRP